MGSTLPRKVVLDYIRKLAKHESLSEPVREQENETASDIAPYFLPSGSCSEFLPLTSLKDEFQPGSENHINLSLHTS